MPKLKTSSRASAMCLRGSQLLPARGHISSGASAASGIGADSRKRSIARATRVTRRVDLRAGLNATFQGAESG